jgi:hypothetical protein
VTSRARIRADETRRRSSGRRGSFDHDFPRRARRIVRTQDRPAPSSGSILPRRTDVPPNRDPKALSRRVPSRRRARPPTPRLHLGVRLTDRLGRVRRSQPQPGSCSS